MILVWFRFQVQGGKRDSENRLFLHSCRIIFDMVTKSAKNMGLPRDVPFDYQLAMDRLRDFRAPRDKLHRLCESGEVIQVKRGLYIAGSLGDEAATVDPRVLSGLVYGPSYVSLETALAHYGMIPERVEEITCMTSKRTRSFETPVGRFRYLPVPERAFAIGVTREGAKGGAYLLALPEKALCDRIAQVRGLDAQREMPPFLLEDLRLEEDGLDELDVGLIDSIAAVYRRTSVTVFAKWLGKRNARRRPVAS